jgi:hypothetical protein
MPSACRVSVGGALARVASGVLLAAAQQLRGGPSLRGDLQVPFEGLSNAACVPT